jgi:transposase-like protein
MAHGDKSHKWEQAVIALLEAPTIRDAAAQVGISPTTLYAWMKEPEFDELYRQARRDTMGAVIAKLQQAATTAVKTLETVMSDDDATPASRVTAARAVLELAIKATELETIEERLTKLEKRMEAVK